MPGGGGGACPRTPPSFQGFLSLGPLLVGWLRRSWKKLELLPISLTSLFVLVLLCSAQTSVHWLDNLAATGHTDHTPTASTAGFSWTFYNVIQFMVLFVACEAWEGQQCLEGGLCTVWVMWCGVNFPCAVWPWRRWQYLELATVQCAGRQQRKRERKKKCNEVCTVWCLQFYLLCACLSVSVTLCVRVCIIIMRVVSVWLRLIEMHENSRIMQMQIKTHKTLKWESFLWI